MKNLILLLLFVGSISSINAQKSSITIRGGINLASQNNSLSSTTLKGATIALASRISVGSDFAIQPEISLIQKGSSVLGISGEFNTTLNYIEIPVLVVYPIVNQAYLIVDVFAGPSIGYGLSGTIEEAGVSSESLDWESAGIKRSDFSLAFGAATYLSVPFSSTFIGKFILDARYLYGLSNIANENINPIEIKNRGLAISLGYIIPFGG